MADVALAMCLEFRPPAIFLLLSYSFRTMSFTNWVALAHNGAMTDAWRFGRLVYMGLELPLMITMQAEG